MSYSSFILRNGSFISERTTFSFLFFFYRPVVVPEETERRGAGSSRRDVSRRQLPVASSHSVQLLPRPADLVGSSRHSR